MADDELRSNRDNEKIYPSDTELRIYPSFTEIREQFNAPQNFKMFFPREVFDQILSSSFSVQGIPLVSQTSLARVNHPDNEIVFVRRQREEPIQCQLVRANDLLLKDLRTGRFFYGKQEQIEYLNMPEEQGTELIFSLERSGQSTVSYLIRGINWSARYNLNIEQDDQYHLQAWADIQNETRRDYNIRRIELFGRDVHLQSMCANLHRLVNFRQSNNEFDQTDTDQKSSTARLHSDTALLDSYTYSIEQTFVLLQKSTHSLPFVNVDLKIDKYFSLDNHFSTSNQKGKLRRIYGLVPNRFLPSGIITIRERGKIVGQSTLNNLRQDQSENIDCGEDQQVFYNRQVERLSTNKDSSDYRIQVHLSNEQSKTVLCRYSEAMNAFRVNVHIESADKSNDLSIRFDNQSIIVDSFPLESKQSRTFIYQVHIEHRTHQLI